MSENQSSTSDASIMMRGVSDDLGIWNNPEAVEHFWIIPKVVDYCIVIFCCDWVAARYTQSVKSSDA